MTGIPPLKRLNSFVAAKHFAPIYYSPFIIATCLAGLSYDFDQWRSVLLSNCACLLYMCGLYENGFCLYVSFCIVQINDWSKRLHCFGRHLWQFREWKRNTPDARRSLTKIPYMHIPPLPQLISIFIYRLVHGIFFVIRCYPILIQNGRPITNTPFPSLMGYSPIRRPGDAPLSCLYAARGFRVSRNPLIRTCEMHMNLDNVSVVTIGLESPPYSENFRPLFCQRVCK